MSVSSARCSQCCKRSNRPTSGRESGPVVVLEGWDTAGKGGVVSRLGWALESRSFKVHPILAVLA